MNKFWKPALLVAAVVVMAIGMLGSGAWWNDSKTTAANTLSSGTLELNEDGFATFDLGNVPPLAPGDKTEYVVVTIENTGTTDLAWFGDLVVVGDPLLKKAVYIDYAEMKFLDPSDGNWQKVGPDNFIVDGVGSGPEGGWYNTLAARSDFGVNGLDVFDNHNGMGTAPYEFMGALKPLYKYQLTLRFGFAEGAGNIYQGLSPLNVSFNVEATQITVGALNALRQGFGTNHISWLNAQILDQIDG